MREYAARENAAGLMGRNSHGIIVHSLTQPGPEEVHLIRRESQMRHASLTCLTLVAVLAAGFCEPFFVLCRADGRDVVRRMCFSLCPVTEDQGSDCHAHPQSAGACQAEGTSLAGGDDQCCSHQPASMPLPVVPTSPRGDESPALAPIPALAQALLEDTPSPHLLPAGYSLVPCRLSILPTSILLL
jgi:hypothetical protein